MQQDQKRFYGKILGEKKLKEIMNFATHNTIYSAKEMILKQTTHSK
jgi:hypothetical protein